MAQCKESTCYAGDPSLILGLGRSPGEWIGYPLQYSWAREASRVSGEGTGPGYRAFLVGEQVLDVGSWGSAGRREVSASAV